MGTLKKNLNDTNVLTEINYFCMKEYSAKLIMLYNTINYTSQATTWNHFEVSTHVLT